MAQPPYPRHPWLLLLAPLERPVCEPHVTPSFGLHTCHVQLPCVSALGLRARSASGGVARPGGALTVVDAFSVPRFTYDLVRRQFCLVPGKPRLHAPAETKIGMYRERFALLHQRIMRNRLFTRPVLGGGGGGGGSAPGGGYCELTQLQALLGTAGETKYVLGALSQLEDGRYYLEDLSASIQATIAPP